MSSFPWIPTTADGSEAVVWVETHITQGACACPITPSTNMGGGYQLTARRTSGANLLELESEHSSASTCEGFASADGRVANFTSGQGLILMKEVLYVIAGKRLPAVFHIGARAFDFARAEHSFMPATTTSWAWSTAAGACCSGAMSRKPQISR